MAWFKRIGLFIAVNALVVITISLVLNLLGVKPYLTARGLELKSLIVFCLIWGMGGAFISLAISRMMAKWTMGVQLVSPDTPDYEERELVQMVYEFARAARLPAMPQVGIYDSSEVNAFATGPSKSRSLVAVSTGLLTRMNRDEVRGVLAHEVAHIANGDMVTMTLIQGIVNAFVMFLARVIAYGLTMARGDDGEEQRGTPASYFIVQFILELVFMVMGSMVVAWFSRYREFRADAGGARLAGSGSMISALERLSRTFDDSEPADQPAIQSLKISGRSNGFMRLFSTHPPLEERIERLKQGA